MAPVPNITRLGVQWGARWAGMHNIRESGSCNFEINRHHVSYLADYLPFNLNKNILFLY